MTLWKWLVTKKPSPMVMKRVSSTQGRNRTGTVLLPLVFETNASTSSATWADSVAAKGAQT